MPRFVVETTEEQQVVYACDALVACKKFILMHKPGTIFPAEIATQKIINEEGDCEDKCFVYNTEDIIRELI